MAHGVTAAALVVPTIVLDTTIPELTMIRNFAAHSANERTFLAWTRSGIAVIVFGFVIEKFNFFILALTTTAATEVGRVIRMDRLVGPLGRYEGLALMLVGIAIIVAGSLRFVRITHFIDSNGSFGTVGVRFDIVVTAVLVLLVAAYCISLWSPEWERPPPQTHRRPCSSPGHLEILQWSSSVE
jgi:putative membrane protein